MCERRFSRGKVPGFIHEGALAKIHRMDFVAWWATRELDLAVKFGRSVLLIVTRALAAHLGGLVRSNKHLDGGFGQIEARWGIIVVLRAVLPIRFSAVVDSRVEFEGGTASV